MSPNRGSAARSTILGSGVLGDHSREVSVRLIRRLDADAIIYSVSDFLLRAQIALGGLNRYVAEEELNLFELAAGNMTETSAGATQIVGRDFVDAEGFRENSGLRTKPPSVTPFPQTAPFLLMDLNTQPGADDGPVIFALLYVLDLQVNQLGSSQTAA